MTRDYKDTMHIDLGRPIYATTYGLGPFHPAIMVNGRVHYWPNITFATEHEAYARACESMGDVQKAVEDIISPWNIYPVETGQ